MYEPQIDNMISFIGDNVTRKASQERQFVDTYNMLDIRNLGWKQLGLYCSADARDVDLTIAIIGSGGTTVGA